MICSVRHGTWWLEDTLDPLRLPEYLTAPLPSYVSLQTALHRRGLIEQSPSERSRTLTQQKLDMLLAKAGA